MYTIKRYTADDRQAWDAYVRKARNGTFLFLRDYMDYHSDRFTDHSLMFYDGNRLHSILPANVEGDRLVSHHGLTFGGLLMDIDVTSADVYTLFEELLIYLKGVGIRQVVYSPVPWVYHQHASEEDLYPLFWICKANIIKRDMGTVIFIQQHLRWRRNRRRLLKRGQEAGVEVGRSDDYAAFWKVLEDNLMSAHGVRPVHTLAEIELLHGRFPDNIILYTATHEGECVAGLVLYVYGKVVHAQYSSATPLGKEIGALDCIYDQVLTRDYADYQYLDFGRSTEGDGHILNTGLVYQKEGFGGRGIVYDTYAFEV